MKQIFRIPRIRAAAVVAAVAAVMGAVVGCTSLKEEFIPDEPVVVPGEGRSVTLKGTISMGGGSPVSKALTEEGVKTFAVGDSITVVYKNTGGQTVKAVSEPFTAEDIHEEGKKVDIRVTLVDPVAGGALRYIYPAAMAKETIAALADVDSDEATIAFERLANQDGTLASIASNLDLAVFDGSLTEGAGLPVSASLSNKLTICKFTVKEGGSDITDKLSSFTVSNGEHTYTLSPAAPAAKFAGAPIYVAMRPVGSGDISFTATDNVNWYEKSVSGKTLEAGSIYPIGITLTKTFDGKATPLTVEAIQPWTDVSFGSKVKYSIDGGVSWAEGSYVELENAGDKVMILYNPTASLEIVCYRDCYIYGNIMSLATVYSSDPYAFDPYAFATNDVIPPGYSFYQLFKGNTYIKNHPTKPLVLPATTLEESCYKEMFSGCTGLTKAPELPATTLTESCYREMFNGCTGLISVPSLPATTLAESCYREMFKGCTGLISAPSISATTLAKDCCTDMFNGCTGLTTAPQLPATELAYECYLRMFKDCTGLTTAPELPATTLTELCYSEMFRGCTRLTTAPELPATTLTKSCYREMFKDCTRLTTAPELPATELAPYCYHEMFYGCDNLTQAPSTLPALSMANYCYNGMFSCCYLLTKAPALPATSLADHCYRNMFFNCINLIQAPPELPATDLKPYCYNDMFYNCKSLTTVPVLPATTLVEACYNSMFNQCLKLSSITCLATDIPLNCTVNWLLSAGTDVTTEKRFITPSATGWTTGVDGIPTGWTRVDYTPPTPPTP